MVEMFFLKKYKFLFNIFLYSISLLYCFLVNAQEEIAAQVAEIDSIFKIHQDNTSAEGLLIHHTQLKKSKKISYRKGINESYLRLINFHGARATLDSLLYYCAALENELTLHPDKEYLFQYYSKSGDWFLTIGLFDECLKRKIESHKYILDDDFNTKGIVDYLIAFSYNMKGNYDLAEKTAKKALKDTVRSDYLYKKDLLTMLAMTYQFKEQPDKSGPILSQILKEATKNKNDHVITYTKFNIPYDYYLRGEYQRSIDSSLAIRKKIVSERPYWQSSNSEFLALPYGKLGNYEKAIYYMKDAIKETKMYYELPELYKDLVEYYKKTGKVDSALVYYDKRIKVVDSLRSMEQKSFESYYTAKIDAIHQAKENEKIVFEKELLASENKKQRQYLIILSNMFLILILIGVSFWVLRKYLNSKNKIRTLEKNEKDILESHIRSKENELSALLISTSKKMEQLSEIRNALYDSLDKKDTASIKRSKKSLNNFIQSSLSKDLLTDRIESQYPGIVSLLQKKYTELSKNDIRHCLLLRLGLSLKETAQLMNVSPNSVKTARYRAKLKIDLPENTTLESFLKNIEETSATDEKTYSLESA